jgi:hypothetical protein
MIVNDSNLVPKSSKKFQNFDCIFCNYTTSRKSQYKRHLTTDKHKNNENDSKMIVNDSTLVPKSSKKYVCKCGKMYKYDSGYYRHKKMCKEIECVTTSYVSNNNSIITNNDNANIEVQELVKHLVKENNELKNMIMNVCQQIQPLTTTNNIQHINNVNSNNKTFNLNFFLNEQCKDALNMSDFIDSIVLNLSDLENTGRLGFVEGLSKLFIKHLEKLDTYKRPIHCSDLKREVLYIKDENKWEKETEDKEKIQKAIKEVGFKNIKQIAEWVKKYPDCRDSESRKNDQYIKITMNAMSGGTKEEQVKNINKIISNIAKEVVIDKQNL